MHSLVVAAPLLAVDGAEPGDDEVDGDSSLLGLTARTSAALGLGRSRHDAHDLGVSHLEVAGAVGGFLCPDLGVQPSELVPSAAINAQQRHGGRQRSVAV
ncbi:uncharacterized protein ColSpa_12698 [Colletotrichum spaethianum]|uniref:Uncharacterized protein n=1 Tax=Colletotrichum spaethianum TaxID=700344 RepID=A0AA37ULS7_9PEZI|nr:uncharacterized protein ColSpa_12698 [Colletotrichum spaethianum]GKT52516.1 hypothetical protein ColSpa_12698 [Colletotrichum spaethianum]